MEFGDHNSQDNSSLSASNSQQEDIQDEMEDLSQDLDLLGHPLFTFDKDPLLSILTKPIEALFDPLKEEKQEILYLAQQAFYDKLTELVFADTDTSELQEINLYNPSVCGKGINKNDLYFRCLDCDINPHPNMHSLLCTQCFENSNHKNHQLIIVKNTVDGTGTCDCGDSDAFKSQGFCQDHQQKSINIEEIYQNFPSEILTQYISVLKKGIYAALSLFEIWSKATSETVKTYIWDLASAITDHLFRFWLESFFEINKAFLPVFWTTMKTGFDAPWSFLWHDCEDLTPPGSNLKQEPRPCTCSLLENLLKISNIVPKDQQDMLESILVECIKDLDFREYLALKFMKYLQFMFNQDFSLMAQDGEPDFNSRILIITIHLYQKEDMLLLAQNSPYFQNTLDLVKRVVEKGSQPTSAVMKSMEQLQMVLVYFLLPKFQSSTFLAERPGFLSSLLDATMTFQRKFFYEDKIHLSLHAHQVFFKSINLALLTARYLAKPLEMGIRLLFNLPENVKISALRAILTQWEENLSIVKLALLDNLQQSFTPCLERIFTSIAVSYLENNITKGGLQEFLKEMLPNNSQQELSKNLLEGVLRALGMIRFAHLIHNYKHGEIWEVYYFVWNAFFETDITTIQLMSLLAEPESLFEILTKNFFSYNSELLEFFAHPELPLGAPYPKRSLIVLEDFLNLLIYIMTDEVSLLNTRIKAHRDCFGTLKFNSRDQRVIEKLLINLLQGHYWIDINQINETFELLVNTTQSQGAIIAKITVQDEKSHKVRIKDKYKSEFDPYTFYKDPDIKQETLAVLGSKAGQKDLVSGHFDKDLPQHLKEIQFNIYQSSLTDFLGNFVMKFCPEVSPLLHPVLKLILLNLQVALEQEEILKGTKIVKKIEKNYFSTEFFNRLDQLAAKEEYKDCEPCITKTQDLIKNLQKRLDSHGQIIPEDKDSPARNAIEEKKRLAQERMAKLKENFAAKQALFAEKNIENKQEESKSEEIEQKVCQHCMDKIHENGEEYGLPVYVTFTNNFYLRGTENSVFKQQEYNQDNILETDWWPVVSSCNHYYHRKCFETLDKTPFSFCLNKWEAYCSLCKTLSNNFLCINEKTLETLEEQKKSFTEKLGESFKGLLRTLNPQIHLINLPPLNDAFFTRAYQYFIEGAYLLPSPQKLQQTFALYQLFFKTFKNHLNKSEEDLSLFSQLSSEQNSEEIIPRLFSNNLKQILSDHFGSLKSLNSILKDAILVKIIEITASQETLVNLQLSDCLSLYQTNQTLEQNIINQLAPLLQKSILAFSLNLSIMTSSISDQQIFNLCALFFEPSLTEEYLTNLLHCIGLESFPEFLNKIFSELKDRPQKETDFLQTLLTPKIVGISQTVARFSPMKFSFPDTFAEFNTTYFPKKCNLCHQYSQHLFTAICMICGEIMCVSYCGNNPNGLGNLNMHARKFHMGMGIFLDIHRLYIRFVSCPLNVNYTQKNLYVDNIGQDALSVIDNMRSTELRVFDWKQFGLNQELADEVNKAILQQGIRRETFAIAVKTNNKLNDGAL